MKEFYIQYPTWLLDQKRISRLLDICESKDCNYVSCRLVTLAYSGRWEFILTEDVIPEHRGIDIWEFINVRKEDLQEHMLRCSNQQYLQGVF
jgi:hypothetical protein